MGKKYYVVWVGHDPGIYDNWEDAQEQIEGYPNARFKSYTSREEAVEAYRADPSEMAIYNAIAKHNIPEKKPVAMACDRFPEIRRNAIAVDAACSKNPGPVEYRGVRVDNGQVIFKMGPLMGGTNNIGEYLALIHAAALLKRNNDTTTPIYSDSRTALAWLRNRHSRTTLTPTPENAGIIELLARADRWIALNSIPNPILKWDTERWGEIPADFGRK